LPEKEKWGEDIKEEFRKEVQNLPITVQTTPTQTSPTPIKNVFKKDAEEGLKVNTKGIPFKKNKTEGLMLSVNDVVSIATKEQNTHAWTDYSLISDNYAEKADRVVISIRKGKLERLISICPDLFGFVIMVEEIRTGRKKLALKSLYNIPEKEIDKVIRTLRVTS
jgi:hypothetical protein